MTMQQYPTTVTLCLISNRPQQLREAIREWAPPDSVCGTEAELNDPFDLAWEHRVHMLQALKSKGETLLLH